MKRNALVFFAFFAAACSAPPPTVSAPAIAGLTPQKATAPKTVGASCKAEAPFSPGDCSQGLLCLPGPGGYCGSFCGSMGPCVSGGVCAESGKGGDVCLKACASNEDCRSAEGYVCNTSWKACALP